MMMLDRVAQHLIENGKFTEEEFEEFKEEIKETYVYQRFALELALRDFADELKRIFKIK